MVILNITQHGWRIWPKGLHCTAHCDYLFKLHLLNFLTYLQGQDHRFDPKGQKQGSWPSRPSSRTWPSRPRPRSDSQGQVQGLDPQGQGQGLDAQGQVKDLTLKNKARDLTLKAKSRTWPSRPRPRTWSQGQGQGVTLKDKFKYLTLKAKDLTTRTSLSTALCYNYLTSILQNDTALHWKKTALGELTVYLLVINFPKYESAKKWWNPVKSIQSYCNNESHILLDLSVVVSAILWQARSNFFWGGRGEKNLQMGAYCLRYYAYRKMTTV